jgi:hypothetical protein
MYAVVRDYSGPGSRELFDTIERRTEEVERIIRSVPGFVSYSLVRSGEGGLSVTVCLDKAGCDESNRRAREWVQQNAPLAVTPPRVSEGNVVLQLSAETAPAPAG